MKKQLFIILFLPVTLAVSLHAHAQIPKQQCPNEWNVWAAGGWQALYCQTSFGSEAGSIMPDESKEELKTAISEYGSSVQGVISIEVDGYELDQSILSTSMERSLDNIMAQMRKTYGSNISIVCEGHTCNVGNNAYNTKLGQKRAEEVRKFLIHKGFNPNKVTATSKGQYLPVVPNTNEANQKRNRRVTLIIRD
jgi:outer membrane protein OmpA-like peptidoglycan-associated protein